MLNFENLNKNEATDVKKSTNHISVYLYYYIGGSRGRGVKGGGPVPGSGELLMSYSVGSNSLARSATQFEDPFNVFKVLVKMLIG